MFASKRRSPPVRTVVSLFVALGCSSQESPRISLPVVVDAAETTRTVATDLGYQVTISRLRVAIRDLQLTVGGEVHAAAPPGGGQRSIVRAIAGVFVGTAHAHPGHLAGGEVTGTLNGPLLVDWTDDGVPLGTATLVVGSYQGANFSFRRAGLDEPASGDPLAGHTLELAAEISREGRRIELTAILDLDDGQAMTGAPFALEATSSATVPLGLRFLPRDPTDATKTIWNGVDFFALADAAGPDATALAIAPGQGAHNVLRRAFLVHDYYAVVAR